MCDTIQLNFIATSKFAEEQRIKSTIRVVERTTKKNQANRNNNIVISLWPANERHRQQSFFSLLLFLLPTLPYSDFSVSINRVSGGNVLFSIRNYYKEFAKQTFTRPLNDRKVERVAQFSKRSDFCFGKMYSFLFFLPFLLAFSRLTQIDTECRLWKECGGK